MFSVTIAALPIRFAFSIRLNCRRYPSNLQEGVWRVFRVSSAGLVMFLGLIIIITLFTVVKLVQVDQGPLKT